MPYPRDANYKCELVIGHEGLHRGRHGGVDATWPTAAEPMRDEEAERDGDARAVVCAIQEIAAATNCRPRAVAVALGALNKHFASRIVELDQRDAAASDGSGDGHD